MLAPYRAATASAILPCEHIRGSYHEESLDLDDRDERRADLVKHDKLAAQRDGSPFIRFRSPSSFVAMPEIFLVAAAAICFICCMSCFACTRKA